MAAISSSTMRCIPATDGKRRTLFLFALLCGMLPALSAQTTPTPEESGRTLSGFADRLMREHDFYRAISVYKELEYFTTDADSAAWYACRITAAYRYSRRFDHALATGAGLLGRPSLPADIARSTRMHLGLSHLQLGAPDIGISWLADAARDDSSGLSNLFLALAFTDLEDYVAARRQLRPLLDRESARVAGSPASGASAFPHDPVIPPGLVRGFDGALATAADIPTRSPMLMAFSSAVIPGLGQALCRHYVDAIQAFSYVAAFAFTTYVANRYEVQQGTGRPLTAISLSVAAVFHLANILGAHRTASYFNQRQRDLHFEGVREEVLGVGF